MTRPTVTVTVTAPVAAAAFTPEDLGTMAAALTILADDEHQPDAERDHARDLARLLHGCLHQLACVQAQQRLQQAS